MIFAFLGVILRPSGFIFECFGGPFGDPGLPRAPPREAGGKKLEVVVCGSSLESLNRHSVDTEWLFLKFVLLGGCFL